MPIVADALCTAYWGSTGYRPASQMCVGNYTGGVDTCQGDSGGPIMSALSGYADNWVTGVQVALTRRGGRNP